MKLRGKLLNDAALRIAGGYLLVAAVWIIVSDQLTSFMTSYAGEFVRLAKIKGIGFVLVTSGLLYVLLRRRISLTERAMERSRRAAERLKYYVSLSPAVIYVVKIVDGRAVPDWSTESIETLFGYTVKEAFQPDWWIGHIHPDDRDMAAGIIPSVLKTGTGDHEYRFIHGDGRIVWIRDQQRVIRDPEGRATEILGAWTDITERRSAEEKLRESEAFRKMVLDNLPIGIAVNSVEPAVSFDYMNDLFPKLYRTDREKLADPNSFWDVVYEDQAAREEFRERVLMDCSSGDPERMHWEDVPISREGGGTKYVSARNIPMPGGERMISTVWDVTDRKLAELRLKENLDTLSMLYTGAGRFSEVLDVQNAADETVRTCVELLGAGFAWLGRAEPDGTLKSLARYPAGSPKCGCEESRWDKKDVPVGFAIGKGRPALTGGDGPGASAVFPLISRGRRFGVLCLKSDRPGFFGPERMNVFQTYAHQASASLENARLFEEATRRLTRIESLRRIDIAITGSLDPRVIYSIVLNEITGQLKMDAACILRMEPHTMTLIYEAELGFRGRGIEEISFRPGQGLAGRAIEEMKTVHIGDLKKADPESYGYEYIKDEDFVTFYAVPLAAKGRPLGVLEVFKRSEFEGDAEWLNYLETIAGQLAIAAEGIELFQNLEHKHLEIVQAYDATIEGWARALSLKEEETEAHSRRVTSLTLRIAKAMGMRDEDMVHIRRGALLHDIGKIGVPDSILLKKGLLTEEEWKIMRRHPVHAFAMLSPIAYLRPAVDIPYCHHEKWDGTGYPRGLKGEEIPLAARIFAVVDVWDALTSDRPYRKALSQAEAIAHIKEQSGRQFDPRVVEVSLGFIES